MPREGITACGACGNKVHGHEARTCPHCLKPLKVKRFPHKEAWKDFLEDRREHGKHVEPVARPGRRRGVTGALAFTGVLMLFAGAGILFAGVASGAGPVALTGAFGEAIVPLAMAAGFLAVAWQMGRAEP